MISVGLTKAIKIVMTGMASVVMLATAMSAVTLDSSDAAEQRRKVRKVKAQSAQTAAAGEVLFFGDMFGGGMSGGAQTVSFSQRFAAGEVVVSFGDRRLYLVQSRGVARAYPIAIPKAEARWSGRTFVSQKRVNPPWTPTPTMRAQNRNLPSYVPGGHPMNPMGIRALYLGSSAYRIHGTDAPWTIGTAASKGCIRMFNEDVVDLYARVPVGTRVTVTWDRFTT